MKGIWTSKGNIWIMLGYLSKKVYKTWIKRQGVLIQGVEMFPANLDMFEP